MRWGMSWPKRGMNRREAVLLEQFHYELLCGFCIPSVLNKEIQHLTLVVDRPPEPVFNAAD